MSITDSELINIVDEIYTAYLARDHLNGVTLKKMFRGASPVFGLLRHSPESVFERQFEAFTHASFETSFGEQVFEPIALRIANASGFSVSKPEKGTGIDLEGKIQDNYSILSLKSGPAWGNQDQRIKQAENLTKRKKELVLGGEKRVIAISGVCYAYGEGTLKPVVKDGYDYLIMEGKPLWKYLSADADMYCRLLGVFKKLGATRKSPEQSESFKKKRDELWHEFQDNHTKDGEIVWESLGIVLVENSSEIERREAVINTVCDSSSGYF